MAAGTGFRVFASPLAPDPSTLARVADVDTVNVADAMWGFGCVDGSIHALFVPIRRVIGPALTVSVTPGNGQMIRRAILLARPGDVIVVNSFANRERAVLGGSIAADMKANGIAGLVVDGAVRDLGELRAQDFPVFARATTTRAGIDTGGKGEVNGPIACGGVVVFPGDVILADEEGIVVVPRRDLLTVYQRAVEVQVRMGSLNKLDLRVTEARAGRVRGYAPVSDALKSGGCIEFDSTWDEQT